MQTVFWISLAVLFYTYVGYGLLLLLLSAFRRRQQPDSSFCPPVTVVIPAYNEAEVLRQKIINTLSLDYPPDKLSMIIVTDGSTDESLHIVREFPSVVHLHQPERRGKSAALNRAMKQVATPYVVFTDANALANAQALKKMMRHFANEHVGGVSGEKRIWLQEPSTVGFGERLYWQYESLLKKANGDFYTIVGAAGELFALRSALYRPIDEDVILDDFFVSATVCLQGYRFLYEAAAGSVEASSASLTDEKKRKVRISAGGYQALGRLPCLLNPLRNPRLAFQFFSHRVLRWVACPLALPLLLISNAAMAATHGGGYTAFLALQVFLYALALAAPLLPHRRPSLRFLLVPHYFLFMILSQYAGFARFSRRRQPAVWEKLPRRALPGQP